MYVSDSDSQTNGGTYECACVNGIAAECSFPYTTTSALRRKYGILLGRKRGCHTLACQSNQTPIFDSPTYILSSIHLASRQEAATILPAHGKAFPAKSMREQEPG